MYWLCDCSCGGQKWVIADALKSGATRSCGCLNNEVRKAGRHGGSADGTHTAEYNSWHSMKQRCKNPTDDCYAQYGGRGIEVCPRWDEDFAMFLSDMGRRPDGMSLERINNNGHYQPGNCEWATPFKQSRNTSRNRLYTFNGETMCIADWCIRNGISHATLHHRIKHWPLSRALTEPVNKQYARVR